MRGALIDDVALAAAVKRGGRIWLGHSGLARSVRAYPTAADIWRMVSRTAYVQLRFSPLLLLGTVLAMALTFLVPPFAALFGHGLARWFGWLAWGAMAAVLSAHAAPLSVAPSLWAPLPACGRRVLSRGDDRLRGQPSSRPRRRVEGTRLSGCRRMSECRDRRGVVGQGSRRREFPGRLAADPPRPARACARVLCLRAQCRRHRGLPARWRRTKRSRGST